MRLPAVSADWLELRADADARARSAELAAHAAVLAERSAPVVHDLGSGTGAMLRWLAPRLPSPQAWVLHDADAGLLAHAVADRPGITTRLRVEALDALRPVDLVGASLVTASALLDVLTLQELRAIVDAARAVQAPVLLSLSVTGRVELDPADPLDAPLGEAFNEHQRRTLRGRRLLGPDAVVVAERMFTDAGWRVRSAGTPWRLGPDEGELASAWLTGWLDAAVEQRPELAEVANAYRRRRETELGVGALRVTVQHRDLLAWPA